MIWEEPGIRVAIPNAPLLLWFFLHQNTIENCSRQPIFVDGMSARYNPVALFTGNTIQNSVDNEQEWAAYLSGLSGDTFLFLFNNQLLRNQGTAIVHRGPYGFLYADNNLINANTRGLSVGNALLLHNAISGNFVDEPFANIVVEGAAGYLMKMKCRCRKCTLKERGKGCFPMNTATIRILPEMMAT